MTNVIEAYQGETIKIEVDVRDVNGDPANLTGAVAKIGLRKSATNILVKECTISEGVSGTSVIGVLLPSETDFIGRRYYEIRLKLNDEVDSVAYGILHLKEAIIVSMEPIV